MIALSKNNNENRNIISKRKQLSFNIIILDLASSHALHIPCEKINKAAVQSLYISAG